MSNHPLSPQNSPWWETALKTISVIKPKNRSFWLHQAEQGLLAFTTTGSSTPTRTIFYAGIGATTFPPENEMGILTSITALAVALEKRGFTLRSGGAKGADTAFARGAGDKKEIFLPATAGGEGKAIAPSLHPAWSEVKKMGAESFHARNIEIILGARPISAPLPVKVVIAWPEKPGIAGGTGQGIRCALAYPDPIPIINLAVEGVRKLIFAAFSIPDPLEKKAP